MAHNKITADDLIEAARHGDKLHDAATAVNHATDLERAVRAAIARIRELPADKLTITEINVAEMLEVTVAKHETI